MKKITYYIIVGFILFSCAKEKVIENNYKLNTPNYILSLSLKKNHQFLREYKRFLKIISPINSEVISIELQSDIGTGANSYLYEDAKSFILVDCNGNWYSINKKNGSIILIGNFWKKKIPYNYLGTFLLEKNDHKIKFKKQKNIALEDIYVYGGG